MPAATNPEAVNAFVPIVGECEDLLRRIGRGVDDHFGVGPDGVTWGVVANAGRVRDLLSAALDAMEGRG